MTIELYDTVLLKDGRKGSVVDRIGDVMSLMSIPAEISKQS